MKETQWINIIFILFMIFIILPIFFNLIGYKIVEPFNVNIKVIPEDFPRDKIIVPNNWLRDTNGSAIVIPEWWPRDIPFRPNPNGRLPIGTIANEQNRTMTIRFYLDNYYNRKWITPPRVIYIPPPPPIVPINNDGLNLITNIPEQTITNNPDQTIINNLDQTITNNPDQFSPNTILLNDQAMNLPSQVPTENDNNYKKGYWDNDKKVWVNDWRNNDRMARHNRMNRINELESTNEEILYKLDEIIKKIN